MADVHLIGDSAMAEIIARHEAVQWGITVNTEEIAVKAEGLLAPHRKTGAAKITTSYGEYDGFVNLEDEAAESIEFGHWNVRTGTYTDGLRIITKAAGLM